MNIHLTRDYRPLVLCMAMSFICVLGASCGQNGSAYSDSPQPELYRYADADIQGYSTPDGPSMAHIEGSAPLSVGAVVGYLNDWRPGTLIVYTRIEIDFGDGSGWQDVTADAPGWDNYHYDGIDPAHASLHIYTAPGEYRVRTRVSYWDGEAVESSPSVGGEPVVTVMQ